MIVPIILQHSARVFFSFGVSIPQLAKLKPCGCSSALFRQAGKLHIRHNICGNSGGISAFCENRYCTRMSTRARVCRCVYRASGIPADGQCHARCAERNDEGETAESDKKRNPNNCKAKIVSCLPTLIFRYVVMIASVSNNDNCLMMRIAAMKTSGVGRSVGCSLAR